MIGWLAVLVLVVTGCKAGNDSPAKTEAGAPPPDETAVRTLTPVPSATPPWIPPEVRDNWWLDAAKACPPGASLRGAAPPKGTAIWCEDGGAVRDGAFSSWHSPRAKQTAYVLHEVGTYARGKRTGLWVTRGPDGKKQSEVTFKDGVRYGMYRLYWPNGKRRVDGWFADGVQHGVFTGYTDTGNLIASTTLTHGNGPMVQYYADGTKQLEYVLADGKRDGLQTSFDTAGRRRATVTFRAGRRVGDATTYSPKGEIVSRGQYLDDMKEGEWLEPGEPGEKSVRVTYRRGVRQP